MYKPVYNVNIFCQQGGDGKHDPRLITIVNLTAVAIRRFIKMAKKINAFKNMCEEDQVCYVIRYDYLL